MSLPASAAVPRTTYRNSSPYPFCPGCGHGPILDQLNRALISLQIDPRKIVIVSDIGCCGLSDQFFECGAFHGLHGRSITYATGIKLARPDLKVIVIMGDGGVGIGGAHLINAARRNIGLTVLVMNNFNFGMTGGQHSVTTPEKAITSTTPKGNLERPLDICATAAVAGAGFVYRGTSFDKDLSERIAEAIRSECFSLLDVWELCTAYFVPKNKASRTTLKSLMTQLDLPTGLIQRRLLPEFASALRSIAAGKAEPHPSVQPVSPLFASTLDRRFQFVVAGSAGAKVRSAARLAAQAAILSGLWAAQRDDYPITVKSGASVSELIFSPRQIDYTGIHGPDALLLLSQDGLAKAGRHLEAMSPDGRVFALPALSQARTTAQVRVVDPARADRRIRPSQVSLFALAAALQQLELFPLEALREATRLGPAAYVDENLTAIEAALSGATKSQRAQRGILRG